MASTATSSRFTPAPTPPPGAVATINDNNRPRPQSQSGCTSTVPSVTKSTTTTAARARTLVRASNPKLSSTTKTTPVSRTNLHQLTERSHSSPCQPHYSTPTVTSAHTTAPSTARSKTMLRKTSSFSQDDAVRNNNRPKLLARKSSRSVLSAPIASSLKTAHLHSNNSDDHNSLFTATRLRDSAATTPSIQRNFFHVNDLRPSKPTSAAPPQDPLHTDVIGDDIDAKLHRPAHHHSSSGFVYARGDPVVDPFRSVNSGLSPTSSPPHSYSPSSSLSSGSSSPYAANPQPEEISSRSLSTPSPLSSAGSDRASLTGAEYVSDYHHNRHIPSHHHQSTISTQQRPEEHHTPIDNNNNNNNNNNHHRQVVIAKESDEIQDARTNRKVLDLQISNASLVSLNKTLERSLHRQRNELRRLKSYFKTCSSTLAFPDDETIEKILSSKLLDDENDEEDKEDQHDGEDDEHGGYDGRLHGESKRTDRDKDAQEQRQRDFELFKSQRDTIDQIDGAINRCMFITETLMGEGRNALEYKVSPADCKLGGRVLLADDEDEYEEQGDDS